MMATALIERVACAIYETTQAKWTGIPWPEANQEQFLCQARSALRAASVPTEEMLRDGAMRIAMNHQRVQTAEDGALAVWASMINCALEEHHEQG